MATDYRRDREARERYRSSSTISFIIGGVVVFAIIAMLMYFMMGDRTPSGNTVRSTSPASETTQPRTVPPPGKTQSKTPAPAPSR